MSLQHCHPVYPLFWFFFVSVQTPDEGIPCQIIRWMAKCFVLYFLQIAQYVVRTKLVLYFVFSLLYIFIFFLMGVHRTSFKRSIFEW
jgi:hypothetical protein